MKRFFSASAVMLTVLSASAQSEQGKFSFIPRLGVNLCSITDHYANFEQLTDSKAKGKVGLFAGVDLQYQAFEKTAFSVGLFYRRGGCKFEETDLSGAIPGSYAVWSNCHQDIDFIDIPIMAHQYVWKGLSINAGIQPTFLSNNNFHGEKRTVIVHKDGSYDYKSDFQDQDVEDGGLSSADFYIPVGISYEHMRVVLDVRYDIPVTKIYKKGTDSENSRDRAIVFSVGYKL